MPSILHTSVVPYEVFSSRLRSRQEHEDEKPVKSQRQLGFEKFVGQIVTQCVFIAGALNAARNQPLGEVVPISAAKSYSHPEVTSIDEPDVS